MRQRRTLVADMRCHGTAKIGWRSAAVFRSKGRGRWTRGKGNALIVHELLPEAARLDGGGARVTSRPMRTIAIAAASALVILLLWLRCPTIITHAHDLHAGGAACPGGAADGGADGLCRRGLAAAGRAGDVFAVAAHGGGDPVSSVPLYSGVSAHRRAGDERGLCQCHQYAMASGVARLLVLTASPALGLGARLFDTVLLLIAGLSGPFAIFLAPVAALWWWLYRGSWRLWRFALVAAVAMVQLDLVIRHDQTRRGVGMPLGIGLQTAGNIFVTDILAVATLGWRTLIDNFWDVTRGWLTLGSPAALAIATVLMLAAAALTLRALWRGPWILRAFLLFVALELGASLTAGLRIDQEPLWQELSTSIGCRYFFHPILAWLAVVICLCGDRLLPIRMLAWLLLAVTAVVAVPNDWALRPLPPIRVSRPRPRVSPPPPPAR
ncbi:hypothetical protein Dimus_023635 [Dionaea muscipula]